MSQFVDRPRSWRYMVAMGLMVAGFGTAVENISTNMVPITVRHFTDNAFLIAVIISLNRLFGFLVNPYVSWKSDHIMTRFGRRRPFFMIGLPATMFSLLMVGFLPIIFRGEARQTALAMIMVFLFNATLQFFQDVNWGPQEELYADTFEQHRLGRAMSINNFMAQLMGLFMSLVALRLADKHEVLPYLCAAAWLGVSIFLVIFVIRERPYPPNPATDRYNPFKHFGMLIANPDLGRVAVISAMQLVVLASAAMFGSLFVTRTLGFAKSELGLMQAPGPFVAMGAVFVVGYLVDRIGPKHVMALGFVILGVNAALFSFVAVEFWHLVAVYVIQSVGNMMIIIPMASFTYQYASPMNRGEINGAINYVRTATGFVWTLALGALVQASASGDPTPFYPDDVKKPREFIARIAAAGDPLARRIYDGLAPDIQPSMALPFDGETPEGKALREALAQQLNVLVDDPAVLDARLFEGVELSRQSRRYLARQSLTADQRKTLNRSLLQDAYGAELSRNVNYRVPYMSNMIMCLIGVIVTLGARPGKYARTIRQARLEAAGNAGSN